MNKLHHVGALAAAALLFTAVQAIAQPAGGGLSIETTPLKLLLANPMTRTILVGAWPGLGDVVMTDSAERSLRSIEGQPGSGLDEAVLTSIQNRFDALPKARSSRAASPTRSAP